MKGKKTKEDNDKNLFKEMAYELAGDIGTIDNEDMINNRKLITEQDTGNRSKIQNKANKKNI